MSQILQKALSSIPNLILENLGVFAVVDRKGNYLYASKAWVEEVPCNAEGVQYTAEDVIGLHVTKFYPNTGCMEAMEKRIPILGRPVKHSAEGNVCLYTSYFPIIQDSEVLGCIILTFFRDADEALQFSETFNKVNAERNLYQQELRRLQGTRYSIDNIIGESAAIQRVKQQIRQAANSVSNVLIEGETGTGKELVSHSIHSLSSRSAKPLIKLNCAAIPEGLAESELFGYEQGAFTGANKGGKVGKFELAHKGTLFLDEINQLSPTIQPKLLRTLQEKEIERVGGVKTIPVDVRLIAATNKPLEDLIQDNKFRSDLYYRLNVIYIRIPPLRERLEDIPLLTLSIIEKLNMQMGTSVSGVSDDVLSMFQQYSWPGNIRELQNILERAMNQKLTGLLTKQDFEPQFELLRKRITGATPKENYQSVGLAKKQMEKKLIEETLAQFNGNKKQAAEHLGISRTSLYNKIRELGIASK